MGLSDIQARIATALEAAGRSDDVTLIAVSKVQPEARIRAVLDEGHRTFGENRVQEAEGRWPTLRESYGAIDLHLIGPLQTNKLARALELFDAIHSLDRDSLARKLGTAVQARGACPTLFVQVNTGREPQKAGIDPDALDAFLATCRTDLRPPPRRPDGHPARRGRPRAAFPHAWPDGRPQRPRRPLHGHVRRFRDRHRLRRHPYPRRLGDLRRARRRLIHHDRQPLSHPRHRPHPRRHGAPPALAGAPGAALRALRPLR